MTTTTATITWHTLNLAGIDPDRAERVRESDGSEGWVILSLDGATKVSFGVCPDPEHIVPEGEHPGWIWTSYERDGDQWQPVNEANYFEPERLADFLASVKSAAQLDGNARLRLA